MPDPDVVFSSESLRCTCFNPDAKDLVVSLDFRRLRNGSFPKPDYPKRLQDRAYLQILCRSNNWFLSADTTAMREALRGFSARFDTVNVFGSSMGGFGALLFAEDLRATQLLLVSPQFSVFPQAVPFETRFRDFAENLDPSLDTVAQTAPERCRGLVIYDPAVPEDRKHKTLICDRFPGMRAVAFPFAGHPAMRLVSQRKMFGRVLTELRRKSFDPARLRKLHRDTRAKALEYEENLGKYL